MRQRITLQEASGQRELNIVKSLIGDPDTLSAVHHTASVFDKQGQYDRVLELYERPLAECEKLLGINHRSTQNIIHDMGKLYRNSRQQEKAESLRLRLPLLSGPMSRTTTPLGADVISIELLKRPYGDLARENKSRDEDGDDSEIKGRKRRKLELIMDGEAQCQDPDYVDACIQHEREYILKKGNLVFHQSECVHDGVMANGEQNTQNSAIALLDNSVKYFEGLRELEQKVSLYVGLRAIGAWSLLQTPVGASSRDLSISVDMDHRLEDIITIGCALQHGGGAVPPAQPWSLQLQPLKSLLIGVFKAIEFLRQSNFSCDQFTILVAYPKRSGIVEMYSLTTGDLRLLFDIIFTDILNLRHDVAKHEHLRRFLDIFGLDIDPLSFQSDLPSYEEIKLLLHSLTLVIQSICVRIHLYSNSHSGFSDYEVLDEIQLIGLAHTPSKINVRIRPKQLACLEDMIGGPIWVLEAFNTKMSLRIVPSPTLFPKPYLLSRISDVVDTWGAASFILQNGEDKIVQINIGGGEIQAVPTDIREQGNHPKVAEVLYHWIPLHLSFQWPSPTTSIRTSDRVLIGMFMAQSHEYEYKGLIQIPRCHPLSQVGELGTISVLGTTPSGWEMDQFQVGINRGQKKTKELNILLLFVF